MPVAASGLLGMPAHKKTASVLLNAVCKLVNQSAYCFTSVVTFGASLVQLPTSTLRGVG